MLQTRFADFETSRIGLGAWAIGGAGWWGENEDKDCIDAIRASVDGGITLIDTAPAYGFGKSEELIGKALEGIRDKVRIQTKCGQVWDPAEGAYFYDFDGYTVYVNISEKAIKKEIEDSLRRLNTDYIDIYITHIQAFPEFPTPVSETMGALLKLKEEGKILAIGVSNTNPANLSEYLDCGKVDVIQEKYSIISRDTRETLGSLCEANDIVFQPYAPLETGLLTGKYDRSFRAPEGSARSYNPWFGENRFQIAHDMLDTWKPLCEKYDATTGQLAIAWTLALGDKISVLCGARNVEQAESNLKGAGLNLAAEDIDFMTKTADEAISRGKNG